MLVAGQLFTLKAAGQCYSSFRAGYHLFRGWVLPFFLFDRLNSFFYYFFKMSCKDLNLPPELCLLRIWTILIPRSMPSILLILAGVVFIADLSIGKVVLPWFFIDMAPLPLNLLNYFRTNNGLECFNRELNDAFSVGHQFLPPSARLARINGSSMIGFCRRKRRRLLVNLLFFLLFLLILIHLDIEFPRGLHLGLFR